MRVSNSKIKTYRRCPNQYRYKYVLKLEPKLKKVQLEMGSWMHELLQAHYEGKSWREIHTARTKAFYNLFEEQREELGDLPSDCMRMMRSYLRYWRHEDQHFAVVDVELDEIVTLPNGLQLHVIIDLIVEDLRTNLLWIWDHKNRKSFESGDNMLLDPQLTNYFDAALMMGYKPLGGVVYNELRTKAPVVPKLTAKTKQLERRKNIDTDVYTYMRAIRAHGFDPGDYGDILRHLARGQNGRFFRRPKLPKDPPMLRTMRRELVQSAQEISAAERRGRFPRTFDRSCAWGCDFKNLCIAELYGGDISSMIKQNFRRRQKEDQLEKEKPWQDG
jgi:RecB family exonuclease